MTDFLMRENAPLTGEEWEKLDELVVGIARRQLVARKFLHLFGPLGAGAQIVSVDRYGGVGPADIAENMEPGEPVELEERVYIPVSAIYKDFVLRWDQIALARGQGPELDLSQAAAAAAMVARSEDTLIFRGTDDAPGLLNIEGRMTASLGDWDAGPGAGLESVLSGWQQLADAGFAEPFALVLSHPLYAKLHRVYGGTGILEIARLRELIKHVYPTTALKDNEAILLAAGPENLDLAIGQDLITAYLGNEDLDHLFRVMETLVLRVKRPAAICTFE